MECRECTENPGELVSVEYTDGTRESIPLCETCREQYADGDLISEIEPVEVEVEETRTNG